MVQASIQSSKSLLRASIFGLLLLLNFQVSAQEDLLVTGDHIIPTDSTVIVNNVTFGKDAHLIVHGTLKVLRNFDMSSNKTYFTMSDTASVIINGNFTAHNQIGLNLSGFLIIHGSFIKGSSPNQGEIEVTEGNIYIFGEVDNWDEDFGTCEAGYEGSTGEIVGETCDYGTGGDFENNHEDFPPEIIDLINCFDLSKIKDVQVVEGESALFEVAENSEVSFFWEVKRPNGDWEPLSETSHKLSLSSVTVDMNGNLYRVITRPVDSDAECSISISREVSLTVECLPKWTGAIDQDWFKPSNWNCGSVPTSETDIFIPSDLTNYPVIASGKAEVRALDLKPGAIITVQGTLEIHGTLGGTGQIESSNGTLAFVGTQLQNLPANMLVGAKLGNFTLDNPQGLSLESNLNLNGTLTAMRGNLTTNGYLTLLSDANQTALISGTGNGSIIGNVTVQRYLDPAYGYKYFSSPVKIAKVGDFEAFTELIGPNNFPHFYRYDEGRKEKNSMEAATGWEAYTSGSNPLNIMEGYAVNFGDNPSPTTISLTGEVNNGSYVKSLSNSQGTYTQGFHLVGNPYPSPIDWDAANGWTKDNIDDGIYFFTASDTHPYGGTYSSYVNGVSSDDTKSSNIIPSMQGFFVQVNASEGTLGMENEVRVEDFSQKFLKSAAPEPIPLLRISAGYEMSKVQDPAVIYFDRAASTAFDSKLDALKIMNTLPTVPSLYLLSSEGKELSISALSETQSEEILRLPLGIQTHKAGVVEFQLQKLDKSLAGYNIYLVDLRNGQSKQLNSKGNYSASISAGIHNTRFELVLSSNMITDPAFLNKELFSAQGKKNVIDINLYTDAGQEANISVSTLSGQVLRTLKVKNQKEVLIEGIRSSGVYIISVKSGVTHTSKKILINK